MITIGILKPKELVNWVNWKKLENLLEIKMCQEKSITKIVVAKCAIFILFITSAIFKNTFSLSNDK